MVWGFLWFLFSCPRHTLTCHQYYLQLRKDILEDRMHCDDETALLLASLALQAEYGDYQAEVHHHFHLRETMFLLLDERMDCELPHMHHSSALSWKLN